MANPLFGERSFQSVSNAFDNTRPMTLSGTINKTAWLFLCLVVTAGIAWVYFNLMFLWIGLITGLVLAMITIFVKTAAPFTATLYALAQGLFLGTISRIFNDDTKGIAIQAVVLTFGVVAVMLGLYAGRILRATPMFKKIIFIATGAIALVYLSTFVMGFFGMQIPYIHSSGPYGIGFSLLVIGIAAFNLIIDFDNIEAGVNFGSPKYMEWYCAFGLMVTIIWLYLEILKLLRKLRR